MKQIRILLPEVRVKHADVVFDPDEWLALIQGLHQKERSLTWHHLCAVEAAQP
jgi:hypothetical protein